MSLVRTSVLNAIATLTRIACLLGLSKVLAVYIGPAGYALTGHFQNLLTLAMSLGGGAMSNGLIKFTSEYQSEPSTQIKIWRSATALSLIASSMVALALILARDLLARSLFDDTNLASVFVWLAGTLFFYVLNTLLLGIINGRKAIKLYVLVNMATSIGMLILSGLLAYFQGVYGALIAIAINQSAIILVTAFLCRHELWFKVTNLFGALDQYWSNRLLRFALMALVTSIVLPLSQIAVREYLIQSLGNNAAGFWQATTKISEVYLMFMTATLSAYYLPRIAEIKSRDELEGEIWKVFKFSVPLTILAAIAIYLMREWMLVLVFSDDFRPMLEILPLQLCGDVIKMASWAWAFVMLGREMTRAYIFSEVLFSLSLPLLTMLLTPHFGLKGSMIAFIINYTFYWIFCVWVVRRYAK